MKKKVIEIAMSNTETMENFPDKRFTLTDRTAAFAADVRVLVRPLYTNHFYRSDIHQLIRASGSVAANYIEANEGLSKRISSID